MCHSNNLETYDYDSNNNQDLFPSELENALICKRLNFLKIYKLPRSQMSAFKDQMVSVPLNDEDIMNTLKSLPRTPGESNVQVAITLKRKKQMKNSVLKEHVHTVKLERILKFLRDSGHKSYQWFSKEDFEDFKNRLDKEELIKEEVDESIDDPEDGDVDEADLEMQEYLTKDPVAKHQFDYLKETVFANDHPEIEAAANNPNKVTVVAPGEGKVPTSILMENEWDSESYPMLDPTSENSLNHERKVKLRPQQFFEQRILNKNRIFANTSSFIFAAVAYIEKRQLSNNINVSVQRGVPITGEDGKTVYANDDAWNVFSNVKGTPKYFKVRKDEFIAKVVNLGPFSWFFTLSCADYHYSENFTALLQDHTISYYFDFEAGEEMCLIDGLSIEEFLKQHESKHEFIRKNILTATRHWEHRLKQFIEIVIKNALGPMCVKYYQTRIEFQLR